jgi:GlpG protein
MELLATFNNPRVAQAFVDYMALQSVAIVVKPIDGERIELYVDIQHYEQAKAEIFEFTKNPSDKKYQDASWQRNAEHNPLQYRSDGNLLRAWIDNGSWITHVTVVICVSAYILAHFSPIYQLMYFPPDGSLVSDEIWRYLTPAFIHFSTLHIVFNLLWWWLLGGKLENYFGSWFLLLFMIFTGVISNWAQFIVTQGNNFGGLSGVVYALFGFSWLYGKLKPQQPIELNNALFVFTLVWLVAGFADMLWINVANAAHLSGLLAGLAFATLLAKRS